MVQWTDRHGQTWDLLLTFGALNRVKAEADIDLAAAMEDREVLGRLLFSGFGRKLVEVLFVLCERQISERGIEPEAWADLFDGATVERASVGVMEAVADFFPRSLIGRAIRENLPKLLAEMDAEILKKMKLPNPAGLGGSGTTSRASVA